MKSDEWGLLVIEYRGWRHSKTLMSLRQGVDCVSYTTASHLSPSPRSQADRRTFWKVTAYRQFRRSMFFHSAFATATTESAAPDTGLSPPAPEGTGYTRSSPASAVIYSLSWMWFCFVFPHSVSFSYSLSEKFLSLSPAHLELWMRCSVPWEARVIAAHPSHCRFKELELCQWLQLWSAVLFG